MEIINRELCINFSRSSYVCYDSKGKNPRNFLYFLCYSSRCRLNIYHTRMLHRFRCHRTLVVYQLQGCRLEVMQVY